MRVLKVTLTYLQHISLAPYNHVDAGLVVEVEPNPEDGPAAQRDLATLIASVWGAVGPATQAQVQTAVTAYDDFQLERQQRYANAAPPLRNGSASNGSASHTAVPPAPASAKQRATISSLREALHWTSDDLERFATSLSVDLNRLTHGEAQALLTALPQQPRKARAAPPPAPPESDPPFPPAASAPPAAVVDDTAPATGPAAPLGPPQTPEEAEQRFYARYADTIGGTTWIKVRTYLGQARTKPVSIDDWIATAEAVRAKAKAETNPA